MQQETIKQTKAEKHIEAQMVAKKFKEIKAQEAQTKRAEQRQKLVKDFTACHYNGKTEGSHSVVAMQKSNSQPNAEIIKNKYNNIWFKKQPPEKHTEKEESKYNEVLTGALMSLLLPDNSTKYRMSNDNYVVSKQIVGQTLRSIISEKPVTSRNDKVMYDQIHNAVYKPYFKKEVDIGCTGIGEFDCQDVENNYIAHIGFITLLKNEYQNLLEPLLKIQIYNAILGNIDSHYGNIIIDEETKTLKSYDYDLSGLKADQERPVKEGGLTSNHTLPSLKVLKHILGDKIFENAVWDAIRNYIDKEKDVTTLLGNYNKLLDTKKREQNINSNIKGLQKLARIEGDPTSWMQQVNQQKAKRQSSDQLISK